MATAVLNEKNGTISAFDDRNDADDYMSDFGGPFIIFEADTCEKAIEKARNAFQDNPHTVLRG